MPCNFCASQVVIWLILVWDITEDRCTSVLQGKWMLRYCFTVLGELLIGFNCSCLELLSWNRYPSWVKPPITLQYNKNSVTINYLEAVSSIHNLRTRHTVVIRDPLNMALIIPFNSIILDILIQSQWFDQLSDRISLLGQMLVENKVITVCNTERNTWLLFFIIKKWK
jgi:hypothetical protein